MVTVSKRFSRLSLTFTAVAISTVMIAERLSADPAVVIRGEGTVTFSVVGPSSFEFHGNASHLGKFTAYGEIHLTPGPDEGSIEGEGIAVFEASNGDLLVGMVNWQVDASGDGQMGFSWRDSVQFSDGTVVSTSGRFVDKRPAGAVSKTTSIKDGTSNTIIAILIG
jgi:hypothetical protein